MLISYSQNFIFFHTAKVAGLSLREALKGYCQEPERFKIRRPPREVNGKPNSLYTMWKTLLLHTTSKEAEKELKEEYNRFFKFAFVRNPWDWQVSMYHFLLKISKEENYQLDQSVTNFEEYLNWVVREKNPYPRGATKFQKEMVTNSEGKLIVNFIGRFESLTQDFNHICQILKINASLPFLNTSPHKDYRSYYNKKTKQIVEEHFQEDITLFGYTFDGYDSKGGQVGLIQDYMN